jgi:hypothetical protein
LSASVLVAVATTDLGGAATSAGLGQRSTTAIEALDLARAVTVLALPIAIVVAAVITGRAVRVEWSRTTHSPARLVYLGSTALMLGLLAVDPVTGFVAYVGAHAAEYLLVVRWRISRAAERPPAGDRVGALARRIGGGGTIAAYGVVVAGLIVGARAVSDGGLVTVGVLTVGSLHLLYDGFIWRSPKPARSSPR